MERIVKLQSLQNYQESAIPGTFTQKLIDLVIPGNNGMSYDLGKSYININMEIDYGGTLADSDGTAPSLAVLGTDTALYQDEIQLQNSNVTSSPTGSVRFLSPCSQLVRNADMFSQNKGMVESIRRVNTLRSVLWNLENDMGEQHDGLDKFGSFLGRRGEGNRTTSMIQVIGMNQDISTGIRDETIKSGELSRDFRIPLSDLFGVGSKKWNGDIYGDTRIHLELQPNNLTIAPLNGSELTSTFSQGGVAARGGAGPAVVAYGAFLSFDNTDLALLPPASSLGVGDYPLVTQLVYTDAQLDLPFYVGMGVAVAFTAAGSVVKDPTERVNFISSMEIISVARATALNIKLGAGAAAGVKAGQIAITLSTSPMTQAAGGVIAATAVTLAALKSQVSTTKIQINRVELVLSEMTGETAPAIGDYRTYTTEETQGHPTLNTLNQQVVIEPLCQNLIIATCPTAVITPTRAWDHYRISIDNEDQTGNRDVRYNDSIHKDRMMRFFENRDQDFTNSSLKIINTEAAQRLSDGGRVDGNQVDFYPILETMPSVPRNQIVNLELDGTLSTSAPQDVIFFKEVIREI